MSTYNKKKIVPPATESDSDILMRNGKNRQENYSNGSDTKQSNKKHANGKKSTDTHSAPRSNMKFFAFITFFFIIPSILIATLPIFSLNLDKPLKANYIKLPPRVPLEGALAPNDLLLKANYISYKALRGAETIVFSRNGSMFTGLLNGWIARIARDGSVNKIVQMGEQSDEKICNNYGPSLHSTPECGRPLGLRFLPNSDILYVADSYYGIFKVDVIKGTKELLVSVNDTRFGAVPMRLVNDIDIDPTSDLIYFIDSSYEREVNQAIEEHLEALPRGRLFSYNEKTKKLEFLTDNLYFPNGLQLMPDKESVLINENSMSRIIRYYLKGSKKDQKEIFIELPGFSDTIRLTDHGTLLVPFVGVRYSAYASMLDLFGEYPIIRTIIGTILNLRQVFHKIIPKYGLVVEYDLKGKPLRSWHDPTGKHIECITNAAIWHHKLYLGSFYIDYIAVLDY